MSDTLRGNISYNDYKLKVVTCEVSGGQMTRVSCAETKCPLIFAP